MDGTIPPPPDGYTLQDASQGASSIPPPPPGYSIQTAAPDQMQTATVHASDQQPDVPQRSIGQDLGRAAVMTGRNVLQGALGIPALVHDALIMTPYNAIASAVGSDSRINPGAQQIDANLNSIGVPNPQPENSVERIVGGIDRGLGGIASGVGIGGALSGANNAVVRGVGGTLTSNIGNQIASTVTGIGSAELAKNAGFGSTGQAVAGLVGGAIPSIPAMTQASAQYAMRGGDANIKKIAQNIADFQGAGTMPSVGQATQNARTQGLESLLAKTPGATGVMRNAAQNQATQVSGGLDSLANQLAPSMDAAKTGRIIERGISGSGGFVDQFKNQASALYNKLDNYLQPDTRVDVSNTSKLLPELNALIPGAPATSKLFQNQRISGINAGLQSDLKNPQAAMATPEFQSKAAQISASVDSQNQAIMQANKAGQARIDAINSVRVGQPKLEFAPQPLIGQSEVESQIGQLASSMVDGKMPYEAIKKLRTLVGGELENFSLTSDVPRSKWKAVYAALSQDLKGAADNAGPDASSAYNRANNYYNAGTSRIDALSNIVDKSGGPEAIFNAATSGTKDGATTLRTVMQSLPADGQKALASTVIRRLGKATPGQQNAAGDEFSMGTFLTNWNKLSPDAKSNLFGRFGSGFSDDMDKVARVASNIRGGSKIYANPSGSGSAIAGVSALTTFITSLLTAHPGIAASVAGGAGGANLTAKLMTNPKFVKFLATKLSTPSAGPVISGANVYGMGQQSNGQQQNIGNRIGPNIPPAGNISNQLQANP